MNDILDCPTATPSLLVSLGNLLGRFRRGLTQNNRLDPETLSAHMLSDLGLPHRSGEDPLARERLRSFF